MEAGAFQIAILIAGFVLSSMTGIAMWQHRDIRQMTEERLKNMQARIDALDGRLHALRLEIEQNFAKKTDYWIEAAGARRALDDVARKIDDLARDDNE